MTDETIFAAALEKPPAERTAYLTEACAGDPERQKRISGLLAGYEQANSFLEHPAVAPDDPASSPTRTIGHEGGAAPDDEVPLGFLAPAQRPDSLGRIGHYEVLQVLGQGGFGIVFRAFDDVLQRIVAVKVLSPQMAATSPARKRFLREARSSAQVRHENVVQVYEVGEQPLPYLVMEFIPGETLQQRLTRTGPLDVPEVLRIGRQIAEGLAAAHATDLIHRDIKPGNVLLEGGAGRVKITDFGLARAADDASISQSGIIAGTPMYMAPEQAKGEHLDHRADLFSLGTVLYQMTAGRPPFRANGTVAVLKRVAEDTPRPIREIIPEAPQWLCDIISKLHAKNPNERYQSAREVADVLADCEEQLKASGKVKSAVVRAVRQPPAAAKSGRWTWASAAALVLLLVTGGFGWYFGTRVGTSHPTPPAIPPQRTDVPKYGAEGGRVVGFVPPTFENRIGMEFVLVPKGKSWLGGGKDKLGDKEVDIPTDFYLGKYAVTQGQWKAVMGRDNNPSHFSRNGGGLDQVKGIPDADLDQFPVELVSWNDAQEFLNRLNALEKEREWVYRLPTSAQWEYACRGGPMADKGESAFDFYLDQPTNDLSSEHANFNGHKPAGNAATGKYLERTCKVGSYRPNRLGLYDMHGNVWQWCDHDGIAVVRGGGALGTARDCSTSEKRRGNLLERPGRSINAGFRVARVPVGAPSPEVQTPPTAVAPFTDADVKRIAALPAAEQVEEVRKELMRRNPGFDGTVEHKIEGGAVVGLEFVSDGVADLAPVRALSRLQVLSVNGSGYRKGGVTDLSPLKGMPLIELNVCSNRIADLTPLKGMPLRKLDLWQWFGTDLTPLKGTPLRWLNVGGGGQKLDLAPLADLPLEYLCTNHTKVSDLTPLKTLPLKGVEVSNTQVVNFSPLREIKTLAEINRKPAAEFWRDVEVSETNRKAADRSAAESVLALGGKVRVEGDDREIKAAADLPQGAFRLTSALLGGNDKVTDVGLAAFKGCKSLSVLNLSFTTVGDPGLAHLNDCTGLTSLDLRFTKVTNAGLANVKEWKGLTYLNLTACEQLTDVGLEHLSGCKQLESLALDGTQVTDAGLAHLKGCGNLRELQLPTLPITDAGLTHLAGLDKLVELNLVKTKVTAKGAEGLAKALPKCKITWDGGSIEPK